MLPLLVLSDCKSKMTASLLLLVVSFPALINCIPYQQQALPSTTYDQQYALATPGCMHHYSSCKNVQDGYYQLCDDCESGNFLRCSNGYGTILTCPKIQLPGFTGYYQPERPTLVPQLFDKYTGKCSIYSTSCVVLPPKREMAKENIFYPRQPTPRLQGIWITDPPAVRPPTSSDCLGCCSCSLILLDP